MTVLKAGGNPPPGEKKEGDKDLKAEMDKIKNEEVNQFEDNDFTMAWVIHDNYLAAPVKTKKEYIKQAIVVKRKKSEKKKLKEKLSGVSGIQKVKDMGKGLFDSISKGVSEARTSINQTRTSARNFAKSLNMQGTTGLMMQGLRADSRKKSREISRTIDKLGVTDYELEKGTTNKTGKPTSSPGSINVQVNVKYETSQLMNKGIVSKNMSESDTQKYFEKINEYNLNELVNKIYEIRTRIYSNSKGFVTIYKELDDTPYDKKIINYNAKSSQTEKKKGFDKNVRKYLICGQKLKVIFEKKDNINFTLIHPKIENYLSNTMGKIVNLGSSDRLKNQEELKNYLLLFYLIHKFFQNDKIDLERYVAKIKINFGDYSQLLLTNFNFKPLDLSVLPKFDSSFKMLQGYKHSGYTYISDNVLDVWNTMSGKANYINDPNFRCIIDGGDNCSKKKKFNINEKSHREQVKLILESRNENSLSDKVKKQLTSLFKNINFVMFALKNHYRLKPIENFKFKKLSLGLLNKSNRALIRARNNRIDEDGYLTKSDDNELNNIVENLIIKFNKSNLKINKDIDNKLKEYLEIYGYLTKEKIVDYTNQKLQERIETDLSLKRWKMSESNFKFGNDTSLQEIYTFGKKKDSSKYITLVNKKHDKLKSKIIGKTDEEDKKITQLQDLITIIKGKMDDILDEDLLNYYKDGKVDEDIKKKIKLDIKLPSTSVTKKGGGKKITKKKKNNKSKNKITKKKLRNQQGGVEMTKINELDLPLIEYILFKFSEKKTISFIINAYELLEEIKSIDEKIKKKLEENNLKDRLPTEEQKNKNITNKLEEIYNLIESELIQVNTQRIVENSKFFSEKILITPQIITKFKSITGNFKGDTNKKIKYTEQGNEGNESKASNPSNETIARINYDIAVLFRDLLLMIKYSRRSVYRFEFYFYKAFKNYHCNVYNHNNEHFLGQTIFTNELKFYPKENKELKCIYLSDYESNVRSIHNEILTIIYKNKNKKFKFIRGYPKGKQGLGKELSLEDFVKSFIDRVDDDSISDDGDEAKAINLFKKKSMLGVKTKTGTLISRKIQDMYKNATFDGNNIRGLNITDNTEELLNKYFANKGEGKLKEDIEKGHIYIKYKIKNHYRLVFEFERDDDNVKTPDF